MKKIFEDVDFDKNGYIDFSEFITATANKAELLTKTSILEAFNIFDK